MSPELVDQTILACCTPRFLKVARIITDVATALKVPVPMEGLFIPEPEDFVRPPGREVDVVAERIKALVRSGQLESQGNLDRWQYSEIRLSEKKGT
jgi:hypothetical protein